MSEIKYHCYDKSCFKEIDGARVYLYKAMDLTHGRGWFCHAYDVECLVLPAFAFSKNRFTAVKDALRDLEIRSYLNKAELNK